MKKVMMILLIVLLFSISVLAESLETGSRNISFKIDVPQNWESNNREAKSIGLPYIIRPIDSNDNKFCHIYGRWNDNPFTTEIFVELDLNKCKREIRNLQVTKLDVRFNNIISNDVLTGKYYAYFLKGLYGNFGFYEMVVYIEASGGVCILVYSTTSEELYKKYYDDFMFCVASFTANKK